MRKQKNITKKTAARLQNVVEYIIRGETDTLARLTVAKLAEMYNIHRSSLNRMFNRQLSVSPEDFLNRQKMIRAAITIMDKKNRLPIETIARKFGYCRQDYFSKCFKDFMAVSPEDLCTIEKERRKRKPEYKVIFTKGFDVSHLSNTNLFGLEFACIIDEGRTFRLIVLDSKENYYIDRRYKKAAYARGSFRKWFRHRYPVEDCFAHWTPFYRPVKAWISSRNRLLYSVPLKEKMILGPKSSNKCTGGNSC